MSNIDVAVRQHLEAVKALLNVRQYAKERFGIVLNHDDKASCVIHGPERTPSQHFYSNGFYCFGCKQSGDFITLYKHFYPDASFLDALDDGANFVGMGPCPRNNWSQEDYENYRQEREELQRVSDIFLDAAIYFQDQLALNEYAQRDLKERWGLTEEFWQRKKVGYAPKDRAALITHLVGKGHARENVLQTGLVKLRDDGSPQPAFRGRIIFPYWVGARIAYFIGRATKQTPQLFGGHDETGDAIWKDPPKYKKLPVCKDGNDISPVVKNVLYGMDFLHDARYPEIVITEGIADAMKAEQHGIPVVSPVTVRLKRADFEAYIDLFRRKERIYIINDNEESHRGEDGAMDIAEMLEAHGCNVRVAIIPRPEGVDKIDLADAMRMADDPTEVVQQLKSSSRYPLVHKILSIDPGSDDMERNEQISSLREGWARLPEAQFPAVMDIVQGHFGLNSKHRQGLESSIKKAVKEERKREKAEEEKRQADQRRQIAQGMNLKDRIAFELDSNGAGMNVLMNIRDWIIEWLKDNGAKFYCLYMEGTGVIYYKKKIYKGGSHNFYLLMDQIAGLNKKLKIHQAIIEYLNNHLLANGSQINELPWTSTQEDGCKYFNLSDEEREELICIDPEAETIEVVQNGHNKHNLVLQGPIKMAKPFIYDPNVTIEEGLDLIEKYIFRNMTCDVKDRYFIVAWLFLQFFVDDIGTRPILQLNGDTSSGKTTCAKMISQLMYSNVVLEHNSTMASIYQTSTTHPLILMDNIEVDHLTQDLKSFLVASATNAGRHKMSTVNPGEIIQQNPHNMLISTSVELFRLKELIERAMIINFDEKNQREGFNEKRILTSIAKNRNKILSAMLKISLRAYVQVRDDANWEETERIIREDYPDNTKKRHMSALVHMWFIVKEVCRHIQWSYNYVKADEEGVLEDARIDFGNTHPDMIHHEIFGSWMFTQNITHREVTAGANDILYFLDSLYKIWTNKGLSGQDDWDEHQEYRKRDFVEKYQVSFGCENGVDYLLCSYADLHYAFSQLSNLAVRYHTPDPGNLRARLKDGKKILREGGWVVGVNARRKNSKRMHLFVPNSDPDKYRALEEKFGNHDFRWMHHAHLKVVNN